MQQKEIFSLIGDQWVAETLASGFCWRQPHHPNAQCGLSGVIM
jgi:hypothetical protein